MPDPLLVAVAFFTAIAWAAFRFAWTGLLPWERKR